MEVKAEKINPYDNERSKTQQVKEMFDSIARLRFHEPHDDLRNRQAVACPRSENAAQALAALNTRCSHRHRRPRPAPASQTQSASAHGIDLSPNTDCRAQAKAVDAGIAHKVNFMTGDCLTAVWSRNIRLHHRGLRVRNFEHLDAGYREMYRVLQPGAVLCVIELSTPIANRQATLQFLHSRIIPTIGRLDFHTACAPTAIFPKA